MAGDDAGATPGGQREVAHTARNERYGPGKSTERPEIHAGAESRRAVDGAEPQQAT